MSERTVDYRVLHDGSLRAEPTPGPWEVEREDGQLLIRAGTGNLAGIPDPDDEDEANARLIASAPTLRAALERILERVSASLYDETVPIPEDALLAAVFERVAIRDEARAALASAPPGGSL